LVPARFQNEIKIRIRVNLQVVNDPDGGKIDRDELDIRHRQGCLARAHHHAQVTYASMDRIRGYLERADRLQVFIQRLNDQQFQSLRAGIFDRADRRSFNPAK